VSEKHRNKRLMSSLRNRTWEALALAQRTLGNEAGFGFNSVDLFCQLYGIICQKCGLD